MSTINLFIEDSPIRRALLKASIGVFTLSPAFERLRPLDGKRDALGFYQTIAALYLDSLHPDPPAPYLMALTGLETAGLGAFQAQVVQVVGARMRTCCPTVPLRMLALSGAINETPNVMPLPWNLPTLLNPASYSVADENLRFSAELDAEIERLLYSKNHSPLGQFSLFAGAPLSANALKLFVLCLLASPEPRRDAYRRIFEAWYRGEDGADADRESFEQWRRDHKSS